MNNTSMNYEVKLNNNVLLTDLSSTCPLDCSLEDLLAASGLNETVNHLVIVPKFGQER